MKRALILTGVAGPVVGLLIGAHACTNESAIDAGVDGSDALSERLDSPEAGSDGDVEGWRKVSDPPGCQVQVPVNPFASMKSLMWTACPSGKNGCERFDTTGWRNDGVPQVLTAAKVSGNKQWLVFTRHPGQNQFEFDLYDRASFSPINAWQYDPGCSIGPVFGLSELTLVANRFVSLPPKFYYAHGSMPQTALNPTFIELALSNQVVGHGASDVKLAFSFSGGSGMATLDAGTTAFTTANGIKWFDPIVVGSDVLVMQLYGATGWSRELRVNDDGSNTVFREVQGHHIGGFQSDGANWFWIETFGDPDWNNFDQPSAELWWAPYTNDPSTLSTTAKKLASVPGFRPSATGGVAIDGYFAVSAQSTKTVYIVRSPDGAMQTLDVAAFYGKACDLQFCGNALLEQPTFVCVGCVWFWLAAASGSPSGVGFAKFQLGPWP